MPDSGVPRGGALDFADLQRGVAGSTQARPTQVPIFPPFGSRGLHNIEGARDSSTNASAEG